jgi:hypothetical protein
MITPADSDQPETITIDMVTMVCHCGTELGSHRCGGWEIAPALRPTYTLGAVERALWVALGGAVPSWLWDAVRADLEGTQR